jgi:hypothetical protein
MPAILKTTQIQEPSSATVNLTLDTSGNGTFAGTAVMSSPYTMRNKIINGAMVIDQRNAGASVTPANLSYTIDRWKSGLSQTSKFTVQQNAASVTPPAGFSNYLGVTSSSAYSVLTGDYFSIFQNIEGLNTVDLAWGTTSAATVTLSFWVRSSLTGTFGGALKNSAADRSYPFTYTISAANTWEQKSVTIAGDTTGTWLTTNGVGISVIFSLGAGATYSGTAGSWAAANYTSATGATSVVGTNGATFYITGVQLEIGTVATPFEYRNAQQELAMCQRYFITTRFGNQNSSVYITDVAINTTRIAAGFQFPVVMRTDPTVTIYSCAADTSGAVAAYNATGVAIGSTFAAWNANAQGIFTYIGGSASLTAGSFYSYTYTASAEL